MVGSPLHPALVAGGEMKPRLAMASVGGDFSLSTTTGLVRERVKMHLAICVNTDIEPLLWGREGGGEGGIYHFQF